ncbi:MAG TPA: dihydropteroate synthase, partial [Chitinophagaceae bacterium]
GRLLVIDRPVVMGILNTTPDSFYSGSRVNESGILQRAEQMLNEGAAILDIGGQSTRPNAVPVPEAEELKRVLPAIEMIHRRFPEAVISVDTYQSSVAAQAVAAGASIVNDVSGGSMDETLIGTVAKLGVPYVCMHIKGTPETMQQLADYDDVAREVLDYFIEKVALCREAGIRDVIIDPGFGFAKTTQHNLQLLQRMEVFRMPDCPLLAGISRKATIYKTLNISPEQALNGTTVLNTIALLKGANILRVHDVKEAVEAITLVGNYQQAYC